MGIFGDYLPNLLPTDPNQNQAARQGLLAFGAALMGGKGSNFVGMLGNGLMAGNQGYNGALQEQQQQRLAAAQQQRWDLENQQTQAALEQQKGISSYFTDRAARTAAGSGPNVASSFTAGVPDDPSAQQDPTALSPNPQASLGSNAGLPLSMIPQSSIRPVYSLPRIGDPGSPQGGLPDLSSSPQSSVPGQSSVLPFASLPRLAGTQSQPAAPAAMSPAMSAYQEALGIARDINSRFGAKAAAPYFEQAKALKPEARDIKKVTLPDGSFALAQFFSDGSPPQIVQGVAPEPEKLVFQNTGRETLGLDGYTGKKVVTFQNEQSPDSAAADRRARADRAAGDIAIPLSPKAITGAAARYHLDGTLPPMGMGREGVRVRAAILNEAANMDGSTDPTQQRRDQLAFKGDMAARNAAVRSFSTGRDGQAVQAANTALNHLDTIEQLAKAQKSGDMRAWNKVARSLGAAFGQTAPTNMNAALIMVAPEISKAVVGVGGTGHERDQALQALNPNGSLDQIIGGTHTMQELFGGRLTEAKRTYERTTKLNDFDTTMLSPAAQTVLARAQQHAAGANGNIPAGAVKMLKADPTLRDHFDAKYGAGAAASILGK